MLLEKCALYAPGAYIWLRAFLQIIYGPGPYGPGAYDPGTYGPVP